MITEKEKYIREKQQLSSPKSSSKELKGRINIKRNSYKKVMINNYTRYKFSPCSKNLNPIL